MGPTLTLLAATLSTAPLAALVFVLPTDDSMVRRSPVIVYGEVRSSGSGPAGPAVYGISTDYAVQVEEVLKGSVLEGNIVVRQPGGVGADGVAMMIAGLPMLAEGDRVLLFLRPEEDGSYDIVELALGMFFEARIGGRTVLLREPTLQGEIPSAGRPEATERARYRLPRDAARFRRWIADRVSGSRRAPDYFEVGLPVPHLVASAFRLERCIISCHEAGSPVRWFEFDRAQDVEFVVQSSGQLGIPGGGMPEVRTAMQVWNEDPKSRVSLVVSRKDEDPPPVGDSRDGLNVILFEDPHDELPGSYRYGEGGLVAATRTFYQCGSGLTPIPNGQSGALPLVETGITTQDGASEYFSAPHHHNTDSDYPRRLFESVLAHELGHAIGIAHSCGDDSLCHFGSVADEALMRSGGQEDGRGAALNSDDLAAARYLYPDPRNPPDFDSADEFPEDPDPFTLCRIEEPTLVLDGGFGVGVCYEDPDGVRYDALDWGLASRKSGLLHFSNRENAEVLINVVDGCEINGHHWVFVAPTTDFAFNLFVTDRLGRRWIHRNPRDVVAATWRDTRAFPCDGAAGAVQQTTGLGNVDAPSLNDTAETMVRRYQNDSGESGGMSWGAFYDDVERANRFRLRAWGIVRYVESCFLFLDDDHPPQEYEWLFDLHVDERFEFAHDPYFGRPGAPGRSLNGGQRMAVGRLVSTPETGFAVGCYQHELSVPVTAGDLWVRQGWGRKGPGGGQLLGNPRPGPANTTVLERRAGARWSVISSDPALWSRAGWTRIGIEHQVGAEVSSCVPSAPSVELAEGYQVSMCFETEDGQEGDARDWGLGMSQTALLSLSQSDTPEVLVSVVDGCASNGYHGVLVAAATTMAFNVQIERPNGERRTYTNRSGELADARNDRFAFRCASTEDDSVSFGSPSYEVAEGGSVVVAVHRSGVLARELTIPLIRVHGGGATDGDYSGVPASLTFSSGETTREFEFLATDDVEDDDGESVVLGFGPLPPHVSGDVEAIVLIVDDDDPGVSVSFGSSNYEVPEGGSVQVSVELSGDPERELTIPLVRTHLGGATDDDYSGVPASLTFSSGDRVREFEFVATDDSDEDYGESVVVGFGALPLGVSGAGDTTLAIRDDDTPPRSAIEVSGRDCDGDWCLVATGQLVQFRDTSTGPVALRRWTFGDGVQSDLPLVDHSWSEPGFYEVTLWVSDGSRESTASWNILVQASDAAGTCEPSGETLCLQDSRYAVAVDWWTGNGETGRARVVPRGTNDAGLFRFFDADNWEILIKVLDGCALNGRVWVYGASTTDQGYSIRVTDTVSGEFEVYRNEAGRPAPAITDNEAFSAACQEGASAVAGSEADGADGLPGFTLEPLSQVSGNSGSGCTGSDSSLCLADGRFEVTVDWSTADGKRGPASTVSVGTNNSGLFYFFDPGNWEMLIKVLDGCAFNDHHWVYAASATDQGLDITVTDTATGEMWTHSKAPGQPAPAITASEAFPDSCSR